MQSSGATIPHSQLEEVCKIGLSDEWHACRRVLRLLDLQLLFELLCKVLRDNVRSFDDGHGHASKVCHVRAERRLRRAVNKLVEEHELMKYG